jgi:hypothetical protein
MRAVSLSLALVLSSTTAFAQDAAREPATDESAPGASAEPASPDVPGVDLTVHEAPADVPEDPVAAFFLGWKFWVGVVAIVLGVTMAIVVDLTTDDPAPSPDPPMDTSMGLRLRF